MQKIWHKKNSLKWSSALPKKVRAAFHVIIPCCPLFIPIKAKLKWYFYYFWFDLEEKTLHYWGKRYVTVPAATVLTQCVTKELLYYPEISYTLVHSIQWILAILVRDKRRRRWQTLRVISKSNRVAIFISFNNPSSNCYAHSFPTPWILNIFDNIIIFCIILFFQKECTA